jgi:hypothetical protein
MAGTPPSTSSWFDPIVNFLTSVRAELAKILGLAATELPALEGVLAAVAGVLASYFPAAGLAMYLITAENWVKVVEDFIKTVDGVVMSKVEAAAIGVGIAPAPLTGDDKNAFVLGALKADYPALPDHIHQLAIEAHVSKQRGVAEAVKP